MNGLTGRGGADSKELRRIPVSCSSLSKCYYFTSCA